MKPNHIRLLVCLLAGLAVVPVVWLAIHPELINQFYLAKERTLYFFFLRGLQEMEGLHWARSVIWKLLFIVVSSAAGMSVVLALRKPHAKFSDNLALSLAASALATSHIFLVQPLQPFAIVGDWFGYICDYIGALASVVGLVYLIRFSLEFPVVVDFAALPSPYEERNDKNLYSRARGNILRRLHIAGAVQSFESKSEEVRQRYFGRHGFLPYIGTPGFAWIILLIVLGAVSVSQIATSQRMHVPAAAILPCIAFVFIGFIPMVAVASWFQAGIIVLGYLRPAARWHGFIGARSLATGLPLFRF